MEKLKQPFTGYYPITQLFGQNLSAYYKADGLLGHQGIDFAMPTGTPIIAPCNGVVFSISTDIKKGEGVTILSDDIFQWNGQPCQFACVHWHMKDKSIVVKMGDKVKTGDLLGLSNNTGQSTGPHLHFSILPLSPDTTRTYLAGLSNGFGGSVDPMPYLDLTLPPVSQKETKIKELQTLLNKWGATLVVDGKFGLLSNKALQNFLK